MKVRDIDDFFRHLDPAKREAGCDGLKFGEPTTEVAGICCTWMATMGVLREAAAHGLNLICAHEPTFYWDDREGHTELGLAQAHHTPTKVKTDFLEEHGMAVIRVHDVWDRFPTYGIHDSWAAAAGLGDVVAHDDHHKVYHVSKQTVANLATSIKADMGLPLVRVAGDMNRLITKVSVGVGSWGMLRNVLAGQRLGADAYIAGETIEWQAVRYCEDHAFPCIFAGHSEAGEQGMRNLAVYLGERFHHMKVEWIATGDPFNYS